MTTALPVHVRQAAARSTMELPFRLPAKDWFSLREAAALCGMAESFIEKVFDEGRLMSGNEHNAATGQRMTKRIPRAWLATYLVRTARYDVDTMAEAFIDAARQFTPEIQRHIAGELLKFSSR